MHDEWGITDGYHDVDGEWHATTPDGRARLREAMGTPVEGPPLWFVPSGEHHFLWSPCHLVLEDGAELGVVDALPPDLPIGYHDLVPADGWPATRLIIHPRACRSIPVAWGVAVQVYGLSSHRSWGIGDLGDLAAVGRKLADAGGRAMLISPLHQPAPTIPQEDSPYFPSSRRAWNPLLLALVEPPPAALVWKPAELIDRDAVWRAKRQRLEQAFAQLPVPPPVPNSVAIWNALSDEHGASWRRWPEELRRYEPDVITARLLRDANLASRAGFHQWCQELVARQLEAVRSTGVDLIGDLAIGFAPDGADAWEFQDCLALDIRVGAPPDPFNEAGQDWGIPPFVPWRLRHALYEPFIATIRRTALRGVQGLRIDHVMGLFRQFWMPVDGSPTDGAYVRFPAEELLAIVCLEAARAHAYVVGEDLGTVEPLVREAMAARSIAGTKVLWFEDEPPSRWPPNSLATVTTHDLPTIAGAFSATDGSDEQRERLAAVCVAAPSSATDAITAAHDALLGSAARLRLLSLDDVCASAERPNHPGTVDRPNWRRRLPVVVDDISLPERVNDQSSSG